MIWNDVGRCPVAGERDEGRDQFPQVLASILTAGRKKYGISFSRTTDEGELVYVAGEMHLATMMRMSPKGLARLERDLIELGYIEWTPHGRQLTPKGVAAAQDWI